MKPDIFTLCILATTILGSTRHVIGFLSSQTAAAALPVPGIGPASVTRLSGQHGVIFGDMDSEADGTAAGRADGDADFVIQPRRHLSAQERNIHDPGDELLKTLNSELGQELAQDPTMEDTDYANAVYTELEVANKFNMLKKLEDDLRAEQELVDKSALLMKMLEDPTLDTLPLIYVEEEEPGVIASQSNDDYPQLENDMQSLVLGQSKSKRSRYYRRYPWKRHNRNRGNYEPEMRYACTPSKEDIFKLLVNLHENRKGNHSKTVNFCNRKRPAKAVFTNIRFLG